MASDRDELVEDPVRRQRYRFNRAGDVLEVEIWIEPGGEVPPHYHPSQEERFEVLAGSIRFEVDGRSVTAGPGERLTAPAESVHRFENVGSEEARMNVEVEPAGELRAYLEEAARLSKARSYTRRGIPRGPRGALEVAAFIDRFRQTTVVTSPPPFVQRLGVATVGRLARRLGY